MTLPQQLLLSDISPHAAENVRKKREDAKNALSKISYQLL